MYESRPLLFGFIFSVALGMASFGAFGQQAVTLDVKPPVVATPDVKPPAVATPDVKPPAAGAPDAPLDPSAADSQGDGDVSLGETAIETEELTADLARKALDGYTLVHEKYKDSPWEDYTDLQEFVDKDAKGKQLDDDIKALGFKSVSDWNLAVTSISVAYNNVLDDQTADIKQQIEDVKKSTDMAQDMKDSTLKTLQASIPSENNTKIIQDLIKDAAYSEKIKLLENTEE